MFNLYVALHTVALAADPIRTTDQQTPPSAISAATFSSDPAIWENVPNTTDNKYHIHLKLSHEIEFLRLARLGDILRLTLPPVHHNTDVLCLDHLEAIDLEFATRLGQYEGGLSLNGLKAVDPLHLRALCKSRGVISLRGLAQLRREHVSSLIGRTSLTLLNPRSLPLEEEALMPLLEDPFIRFRQ